MEMRTRGWPDLTMVNIVRYGAFFLILLKEVLSQHTLACPNTESKREGIRNGNGFQKAVGNVYYKKSIYTYMDFKNIYIKIDLSFNSVFSQT